MLILRVVMRKLGVTLGVTILIVLSTLLASAHENEDDSQLVLVQIVFRHGDRTPVRVYPTDPNDASVWKKFGGLGQLTQLGMRQHYEFGYYLRGRYESFLNKMYSPDRVDVKSTNYDRTMMSAQSLLASLYKPVDYQVWNQTVLWQPIPVKTADLDQVFMPDCPRYNQLFDEILLSEEFAKANDKYKDLIEVANRESGRKDNSLRNLWEIADTSSIEKNNNLILPKWIVDNYDQLMKSRDDDFYFKFRTPDLGKFLAGGVLNDIKVNIEKVIKEKGASPLELVLYSAHDTYLSALIKLLGLDEPIKAPPVTSAMIFELHKSTKQRDQYFIRVYTKLNQPSEEISLREQTISGCDESCPFEDFKTIVADKAVDNPSVACKKQSGGFRPLSLLTNLTFMVSVGLVVACTLLVAACTLFTYRRVFRQRSGYLQQEL